MSMRTLGPTGRVLSALALGTVMGLAANWAGPASPLHAWFFDQLLDVLGTVFISSLQMITVPLVFVSLVSSAGLVDDSRSLARIGGKTLGLFLCTTVLAVTLGATLTTLVAPGDGQHFAVTEVEEVAVPPSLKEVLIGLVPSNPVKAMADGNMPQVIFCGLLVCVAITMAGENGRNIQRLFVEGREVLMRAVEVLMLFAPFGVFALATRNFAEMGVPMLVSLAGYVAVLIAALILHVAIVHGTLLRLVAGLNPWRFLRKIRPIHAVAFSTSSSGATTPTSLRVVEEVLGVERPVTAFVIPFGVSVNKDATAVMHGVASVFIAQMYGIELGLGHYITIVSMSVLSSLGTAGVPGTAIVMLAMVLNQAGLPLEGIGLLLGVDRLLDMIRTTVNVTAHASVACVVAASEGQLDREVFAQKSPRSAESTMDRSATSMPRRF